MRKSLTGSCGEEEVEVSTYTVYPVSLTNWNSKSNKL